MKDLYHPLISVLVPLLQSVVTGVLTGLVVGLVSALAGVPSPALAGLIAGAGVQLLAWLSLLARWKKLTAFLITGKEQDIPQLDTPQPAPAPLRIEVIREEGDWLQYADLDVKPEQLEALARGIIVYRQSFSEDSFTGRRRAFSRSQFRQLRDTFISRGWLTWKDAEAHSQGLEVTHAGRAVLKYFSEVNVSPALLEEARRNR